MMIFVRKLRRKWVSKPVTSWLTPAGLLTALWWAYLGLLCATTLYISVVGIIISPLGYDEAYNLQVPVNLASHGTYATNGGLYDPSRTRVFDSLISTGPTLLLPIGALFKIFGVHLWLARLVPTTAFIALVACVSKLGGHIAGRWGALAAFAGVLSVNSRADLPAGVGWPNWIVLGGGDVLGEIAATAFLGFAALMFSTRPRFAGLALGLAILTKFVILLTLPAFWLAVPWALRRHSLRQRSLSSYWIGFHATLCVPLLGWQVLKLALLGMDAYATRVDEFTQALFTRGSGLALGRSQGVLYRLQLLFHCWYLPWLVVIMLLLGAGLLLARLLGRTHRPSVTDGRDITPTVVLGSACAVYLLWWLYIADFPWVRHLLPVLLLGTPLITAWIISGLRAVKLKMARETVAPVVVLLLAVPAIIHATTAATPPRESLAQQRDVARVIKESGVESIAHIGWWQNPELVFLSGVPSHPLGSKRALLAIGPQELNHDPVTYREALSHCGSRIYAQGGYVLCWTRGPAEPTGSSAS